MKTRIIAAITGGVWLAAIGSAVAMGFALNRPVVLRDVSGSWPSKARISNEVRQPVDVAAESPVLQVPPVVIVGDLRPRPSARGVTEMQAPNRVFIGPGVVTYPPESFSKSNADRIRWSPPR